MADWSNPASTSLYHLVPSLLKARDVDAITLGVVSPTNPPTSAIRYVRASNKFQEWNGSTWIDLLLSIAGGGTGASSAASARTNLGLGTMATQNKAAVAITDGDLIGVNFSATGFTSGTFAQARLGTGSGGLGTKFLADDKTYKDGESVGTGKLWFTNVAPSGYLLCDGSIVSRATYSALFAVIGTIYGIGDGSTTFALPDFRQRIPFGKTVSGTGSVTGTNFGTIDHLHTGPNHTHTYTEVPNHTHTVTDSGHTHPYNRDASGSQHGHKIFDAEGSFIQAVSGFTSGSSTANLTASNPISGVATGTTALEGTGNTSTNNPPFLVIQFIIKY